jgi:two-component system LytT family response regulator
MIRYVIIEDEQDQIEVLNMYMHRYHSLWQFAGSAGSISKAVHLIQHEKPDIVFLDIHLEDGNGFEVMDQLSGFSGALIVFTAFEDQALPAFRHDAVDFIEKPINRTELANAMDKVQKILASKQTEERYILSLTKGKMMVNYSDIIALVAKGAATLFYLFRNGKIEEICSGYPIGKHEEKLSSPPFYRVHDKYLLNINHLDYVSADNALILYKDRSIDHLLGHSLSVSQHKAKAFKEWLRSLS